MSKKIGIWIKALRLYSLMVSSAGIILGFFIAAGQGSFSWSIAVLTLLTTWSLHLLCNVSNDYGDAVRNTDKDHDFGDTRYVQEGLLTLKEVKNMCIFLTISSILFGTWMIFTAFGWAFNTNHLIFFTLGLFAIIGAIFYTNGRKPYGYMALGDLAVFLFFGLATVIGSFYLQTQTFEWSIIFPAFAMGMPIIGLLNNNNVRDIEADPRSGKKTVAYLLKAKNAKRYQYVLICLLFIFAAVYAYIYNQNIWDWLFMIMVIPFFFYLKQFSKAKTPQDYHLLMGPISMLTLAFGVIFGLGLYL